MPAKVKEVKTVNYPFLTAPVEIYELENGHKVVFAKKEGDLINISSWVKTGSINEDDHNNGISHFLEHLMFKGTTKFKAGEFDRLLESKGAVINAATWKDYTFYYITMPKGVHGQNVDFAIKMHADMMVDARLPREEIGPEFDPANPDVKEKRERYVVIEEIRMRDDQPWTKTYNEANHNMYDNHPYGRDVIGTKEIIANISQEEIVDYYNSYYTPENITTIVAGDIDFEKALTLIRGEFKFKHQKGKEKPGLAEVEPLKAPVYVENKGEINTGFLIMGFHGAKATDNKGTILLEIVSLILGDGISSRLYQNLIEKSTKSIFNVIDSGQYQFKDGNTFFINANFDPQHKEQAITAIKEEVRKMQDELISDEELEKACKKLKVKFADSAETVSEIAETIGYYMTVCESLEQCGEYLTVLQDITKEDVQKACQKYLDLNTYSMSILMPQ
ncbi:MAG: pitrilysin family protein [Candidatus Gastranaerophilales bacterium]|nr:pitrilysin family protein [Candidatus Gastranaerophilales bacterium]